MRGKLTRKYEAELYKRNIQIGADGSILRDRDHVYVLYIPLPKRLDRIDYFHGISPFFGGVR